MDDTEDVKKINSIIDRHKAEVEDTEGIYAEIVEDEDDSDIDDDEFTEFQKSDNNQFNTYIPSSLLTDVEQKVVNLCNDPELKQLLILNRNKKVQLMQVYKKVKDLLIECQNNILIKRDHISAETNTKRVCNKIWRLGRPYFKSKHDFPCPRNADTIRKQSNCELYFYEMSYVQKWPKKDTNRLLKGVAFYHKRNQEVAIEKQLDQLMAKLKASGEDSKLQILVEELKNKLEDVRNSAESFPPLNCQENIDWDRIASQFLREKYTPQETKIFWNSYLHPDINKGQWTEEENLILKDLVAKYTNCEAKWDKIAEELGNNRTGLLTCSHYFSKLEPPRLGRFSPEEDKLIWELVEKYKQGNYIPWTKIIYHFEGRTRSQLFSRYKYVLSTQHRNKGRFSTAEDILLMILVDRFGRRFAKCGEYFPNRSVNQIKTRYSANLRAALKKGSFSEEEDIKILEYANQNGTKNWEGLTKVLNRCRAQIRQRYKTLHAYLEANPDRDIKMAPRRRHASLPDDTEYNFLRFMADQFKNYEKIPSIEDISKLLERNPMPKAVPLQRKPKKIRVINPNLKKETTELHNSSSENDQDDSEITTEYESLGMDDLLTEFFSNSIKLDFKKNINQTSICHAAATVNMLLSALRVELYIPKNYHNDDRLDSVDLAIFNILTIIRPPNTNNEYLIERHGIHISTLIPPNLNTLIGMRSLLIKNQLYKSKLRRDLEFEDSNATPDKQIQWCINSHLSNQSENTRNYLVAERNLFFKRFVALFKFPAIMSLEKPSDILETSSKAYNDSSAIKMYKRKYRQSPVSNPIILNSDKGIPSSVFDEVFIKQKPPKKEFESEESISSFTLNNVKMKDKEVSTFSLWPKATVADQLKRKISLTLSELTQTPPAKKNFSYAPPSSSLHLYKPYRIEPNTTFQNGINATLACKKLMNSKKADHVAVQNSQIVEALTPRQPIKTYKRSQPATSHQSERPNNASNLSNVREPQIRINPEYVNIKAENAELQQTANKYYCDAAPSSSLNLSKPDGVKPKATPKNRKNSSACKQLGNSVDADHLVRPRQPIKTYKRSQPASSNQSKRSNNTSNLSVPQIQINSELNIKTEHVEGSNVLITNFSKNKMISVNQDFRDLQALTAALKKEKVVDEETFDL